MRYSSLALFLTVNLALVVKSAYGDPVLSEVFPNPKNNQGSDSDLEFIELFNPTLSAIVLDGSIEICTVSSGTCSILTGTLQANSYFLICRNAQYDFTSLNSGATSCDYQMTFDLSDGAGGVQLIQNGVTTDEIYWASASGKNAGSAYRRSSDMVTWEWTSDITPGFGSLPTASTANPTAIPSGSPSASPSISPSDSPSGSPSISPSDFPSGSPTRSGAPSELPTKSPSTSPSGVPTGSPSSTPSARPSPVPSISITMPTPNPNPPPSMNPTQGSTIDPSTYSMLQNWNFEDATLAPWTSNGGSAVVEHIAGGGSMVASVTGRTQTWQGIGQNIPTDTFIQGELYHSSVRARLLNVDSTVTDSLKLTLQVVVDGQSRWNSLASTNEITNQWVTFEGDYGPFNIAGSITFMRVFAEGASVGLDFAIDDVKLTQYKPPTFTPTLIDANMNTEHVIIPQPPVPDLTVNTNRVDCPHLGGSLVNWFDLHSSLSENENVALPENTNVLVSQSIPTKLGTITIPATSALIFGEDINGISMDVGGMDVQGSLVAGSETCRYLTPLTITLHGSRPADNLAPTDPVTKGISVTGTLSFHGKRYYRTWTRLARRTVPGENFLYLQDEVNWEPGQEIVLITTAMRDSRDWHENEVFVISSVETTNLPDPAVKSIVYLTRSISHVHIARSEYQAEIGLLSRTIKVQGAEADSPPTDTTPSSCTVVDHNNSPRTIFGYDQVSCPNTFLTGYGGHIIIHGAGKGFVEGIELHRMGQTNFMGRYPIHYHVLGDSCSDCYFRESSIHKSFYRCISIHGTNNLTVSENVGYDVTGYCYYLEDGVEEHNTLSYNLAAHIHFIGSPAIGAAQYINVIKESADLLVPADVTAAGFYITNMHNVIKGNVASGGWAGFAFPALDTPTGLHKNLNYSPRKMVALEIDGNTVHSTAFFWNSAAGFYLGGSLYYDSNGKLEYNAGRPRDSSENREPCIVDTGTGDCESSENLITNSKVYQVANVGIGSWTGKMDIVSYECHDIGLALEALASGFWIDQMQVTCRTGELLKLPVQNAFEVDGNGFVWYDTGQDHIITDSSFTNCGYRSSAYDQYDASPTRGCDGDFYTGCTSSSSVFGFLTHSDQFNPEVMQATKNITMNDVGRRFRYSRTDIETVSGRTQNWYDTDGTASGLGEPTLIGSGLQSAGSWWRVDDNVVDDVQGPVTFIKKNDGAARGLAHIRIEWDDTLHATVGTYDCLNGRPAEGPYCLPHGYIRHVGQKFATATDEGLPVTAQPDVAGLAGGYGWIFKLDEGAPKQVKISGIEVNAETPVLLSIQYPLGVSVTIKASAVSWCNEACDNSCEETFTQVGSVDEVRNSDGNVYHHDALTGIVTIRVVMFPERSTGFPYWKLFDFDDILPSSGGGYALKRFQRKGVLLPKAAYSGNHISIVADCAAGGTNNAYCIDAVSGSTSPLDDVCSSTDYEQVSYDRCCSTADPAICEYPYSTTPNPTVAPTISPAPTIKNMEVLENGGFDGLVWCPWDVSWNVVASVETSNVFAGDSAVRVSQRTQSWQGMGQEVFGRFELDVSYQFTGAVYVENSGTANSVQASLRVNYDTSTEFCSQGQSYHGIFTSNNVPGYAWFSMNKEFTLSSSSLVAGCRVTGIRFYVQTPGFVYDHVLDDLSVMPVPNIFGR